MKHYLSHLILHGSFLSAAVWADSLSAACGAELAVWQPTWNAGQLAEACRAPANPVCVIAIVEERSWDANFNPGGLNYACRDDVSNCAGRLVKIAPSWAWHPRILKDFCRRADFGCVTEKLLDNEYRWSPQQILDLCGR